jgi:predicted RNA-binding protein with PIN domain
MSAPFLIVDGYNLMHAAGLARANYGPGDLARQRHELLVRLARRLTTDERKRCTVVFDAIDAPPNLNGRFKHDEMLVQFAKPGHEADEVIEALIIQHSAAKRLTVVSSDHRLQTAIRRRKGIAVDSEIFLKQLESSQRTDEPKPRVSSDSRNSESDLDFWLREFEAVSPDVIQQQLIDQAGDPKSDWDHHVDELQKRIQDPSSLDNWLNDSDGRHS